MKRNLLIIFIFIFLNGCVGSSTSGIFGSGVSVALDPRTLGTQIDTSKNKIGVNNSISITGTAGTVVFFHCRSVHGSGSNQMNSSRPLILFGYRACDAWPLINDGNPHPEVNLENYNKNIIVGKKSLKPRLTKVPTIIPLPKKKHYVSIYELQKK